MGIYSPNTYIIWTVKINKPMSGLYWRTWIIWMFSKYCLRLQCHPLQSPRPSISEQKDTKTNRLMDLDIAELFGKVKFRTASTSCLNLSQNAFTKKIRSRIYFWHKKTFIFKAPIVRSRLHNHLETGVTKSIFPFHEIKMGLGLDPYQSKVRLGFGSVSIFVLRYHNTSKWIRIKKKIFLPVAFLHNFIAARFVTENHENILYHDNVLYLRKF